MSTSDATELGKSCPTCNRDDFDTERAMQIHHAQAHGSSVRYTIACEECGDEFPVQKPRLKTARFCSNDCRASWMDGRTGPESIAWEGGPETANCERCGVVFAVKSYKTETARFCSQQCACEWKSEAYQAENAPGWLGGRREDVSCDWCDESFEQWASRDYDYQFCSRECQANWQSANRKGPNSPTWRGGRGLTEALRRNLSERAWPMISRENRADQCRVCGTSNGLCVHHIVPVAAGGINESWNLMTLCRSCHGRVEARTRELFTPIAEYRRVAADIQTDENGVDSS